MPPRRAGEYEEINADEQNNLLIIRLYSLNTGDTIQYKTDDSEWTDYDENDSVKLKNDTVLQLRSVKDGKTSSIASYVYHFVPLAPIITLPSGRYLKSENRFTTIEYDARIPTDKDYTIMYRENGRQPRRTVYQSAPLYRPYHVLQGVCCQ